KGVWKTKKNKGIPIKISVPRFQQERCFPWFQKKARRLVCCQVGKNFSLF
ncbi:MAG: hypothetical protein HRU34_05840, partial [Richelia sp.]|nr:hypothetical protein [Richelia sp.]